MSMQHSEVERETVSEEARVSESPPEADAPVEASAADTERRRIEEQLAQLERKQAELRRALALADHPGLGDAIREIEGRAYGVARVEERLAQPLSKSEEKRLDKLHKKLEVTRAKRDELDLAIAELEAEVAQLGDERIEALETEHQGALRALFSVLAAHADAFDRAGLQVTALVPDLERWLPALRALADRGASVEA